MRNASGAKPRVVVDANLLVSGTILPRGTPFALLEAWRHGAVVLVTSPYHRAEVERTLRKPKLVRVYGITQAQRETILRRLAERGEQATPRSPLPLPVRDDKDGPILGTALAGGADYLVTGDKDLLVLADDPRLGKLQVVTVAQFLALLRAGG